MSKVFIPEGYRAPLSVYELQRAIEFIKSNFRRICPTRSICAACPRRCS